MINHYKTRSEVLVNPVLTGFSKNVVKKPAEYRKRVRLVYHSVDSKVKELVLFRLINQKLLSKNKEHNFTASEEKFNENSSENKHFQSFHKFQFDGKFKTTDSPVHLYPDFRTFASPQLEKIKKMRIRYRKHTQSPNENSALMVCKKAILPSISSRGNILNL
jgi:hypothetical protein